MTFDGQKDQTAMLIAREVYAVDAGRLSCSWRLQELNLLLEVTGVEPAPRGYRSWTCSWRWEDWVPQMIEKSLPGIQWYHLQSKELDEEPELRTIICSQRIFKNIDFWSDLVGIYKQKF